MKAVYIFGMVEGVFLLILWVCARKKEPLWETKGIVKQFEKIGLLLYDIVFVKTKMLKPSPQIHLDLDKLNLGRKTEQMMEQYVAQKISKLILFVVAGTGISIIVAYQAEGNRQLMNGYEIEREDFTGQTISVPLEMITEEKNREIVVDVSPRRLTEGELMEKKKEFRVILEDVISGENESLNQVIADLNLVDEVKGYPFSIEWESSNYSCVSIDGRIAGVNRDTRIQLTATISYFQEEWIEYFDVTVIPKSLSVEEEKVQAIGQLLMETNELSINEKSFILPASLNDEEVRWRKVVDDYSFLILGGSFIIAFLIYMFMDKDLHTKVEERKNSMQRTYPDIVQKMVLYLGAGMTVRGAFQKIAETGNTEVVFEEMIYTCRSISAGLSEVKAYEQFGRRTDLQEYIRLCTLLQQNLKKGSNSLLPRLREEAEIASRQRIQNCRQKGEEAVTKLLLPMVLELLVVMIMIMWPAFSSMGL